jgi:hypothetical protein
MFIQELILNIPLSARMLKNEEEEVTSDKTDEDEENVDKEWGADISVGEDEEEEEEATETEEEDEDEEDEE